MNARLFEGDGPIGGGGNAPATAPSLDDVVIAPIHAGMRARAIADACDRLALPAIMIDATGRVLHVGDAATALLDETVSIAAGHLVGRTSAVNRAIATAVTTAIGGACDPDEDGSAVATGLRVNDASPYQLMRGVVVLAGRDGRPNAAIATLRDLLG